MLMGVYRCELGVHKDLSSWVVNPTQGRLFPNSSNDVVVSFFHAGLGNLFIVLATYAIHFVGCLSVYFYNRQRGLLNAMGSCGFPGCGALRVGAYFRQATWCCLLVVCWYGDIVPQVLSLLIVFVMISSSCMLYYRVILSDESTFEAQADSITTMFEMLLETGCWVDTFPDTRWYTNRYGSVFSSFDDKRKWFGIVDGIVIPFSFGVMGSITSQSLVQCTIIAGLHLFLVVTRLTLVVKLKPYRIPLDNYGAMTSNILEVIALTICVVTLLVTGHALEGPWTIVCLSLTTTSASMTFFRKVVIAVNASYVNSKKKMVSRDFAISCGQVVDTVEMRAVVEPLLSKSTLGMDGQPPKVEL